jgi:hypothetical protein
LVQGSFDLQATREAAEAIQDNDGQIKARSQVAAEQVLQRHDQTQLWVDLTLGMTKHQKEEHEWQQAIQAMARAKANGLNLSYNFKDAHSINPVEGRLDDGTAFTKTRNVSLGKQPMTWCCKVMSLTWKTSSTTPTAMTKIIMELTSK